MHTKRKLRIVTDMGFEVQPGHGGFHVSIAITARRDSNIRQISLFPVRFNQLGGRE